MCLQPPLKTVGLLALSTYSLPYKAIQVCPGHILSLVIGLPGIPAMPQVPSFISQGSERLRHMSHPCRVQTNPIQSG